MKIVILGAGPAGLYCGLLIKKAHPTYDITILERNSADVTYGWGVVFSDRTLASFQRADFKTYEQITNHFVIWDAIDVRYRDEMIRCGGHVIASIARKLLLAILQQRCIELGITLCFNREISALAELDTYDLLIAGDGINSIVRRAYATHFKPEITQGKARYIWLGVDKVLSAFTFIFRENEHGLFQVHAYPFSGTTSTFIVECAETTWLHAGLDRANEAESLNYCQRLFADDLNGATLLSNNAKWISFPTLTTQSWHYERMVLLGDAAHTAHFSIGSGTKLAMEDAIALAHTLDLHADLTTALNEYELERKPVVEIFQHAAQESQIYFEEIQRYLGLDPMTFAFQLLTRSGRITYDDLRVRDGRFGEAVDRVWAQKGQDCLPLKQQNTFSYPIVAPPPMLTPLKMRSLQLSNRVVLLPPSPCMARQGIPSEEYTSQFLQGASSGAGLLLTEPVAISATGRITSICPGMYNSEHLAVWAGIVASLRTRSTIKIAMQLSHAGRRGSTRPRNDGLDRPLQQDNWPLLSASPLPYTTLSQVPKEMNREDMDAVCNEFVLATQLSQEAGIDLLVLNFAHGYLLASFLSPLTNHRHDEYGGDLTHRVRYPLKIFDAVRAAWPQDKPLAVALSATDYTKGGLNIDDAVIIASMLKEHGCNLILVQAGQAVPGSEAPYKRGFLTPLSDQLRNRSGIPTMVGGYLTTSNEVNTIIAAGRADLCILDPPHLSL